MFKNRVLTITGGTGSFGEAVLKRLLKGDIGEIRVFSRDEKKQDDMRRKHSDSRVKFYIGDVRDRESINSATFGADFVFHAAALKQVPSCEFHPMEAYKTNVVGTNNVLDACIYNGVSRVVCLSTDKAVYPINAMGISKAMMEKVMVAKAQQPSSQETIICGTRYGNVMGSRGSVIPLFIQQLSEGRPLTITDPNMTRFMMTLTDAVDLVSFAFKQGKAGDLFVQKSPAATIDTVATATAEIHGKSNYPTEIIGTRHGEKLFEVLLSREEMTRASDLGDYFVVPSDLRERDTSKYFEKGVLWSEDLDDYNSHNTNRLNVVDLKELMHAAEL